MLQLQDYTFSYSESSRYLWQPLNFTFEPGQIVVINGSNGSGKTTLLNSLCGIIPTAVKGKVHGQVLYLNKPLESSPLNRIAAEINILFQEPDKQIFMPVVEEEIAFGPENLRLSREVIRKRIELLLAELNIEHLRHKRTADLSFGQKKMTALAGILSMSPQVLLIDEFCAGMHDKAIKLAAAYVQKLKRSGKLIIFAEHHHSFQELADITINLDHFAQN